MLFICLLLQMHGNSFERKLAVLKGKLQNLDVSIILLASIN